MDVEEVKPSTASVMEGATPPSEEADVYPHGARLVIIMAALCLAIFLTALDQVSLARRSRWSSIISRRVTNTGNRRLSAQQSPESPMSSKASTRSHGTDRPTS